MFTWLMERSLEWWPTREQINAMDGSVDKLKDGKISMAEVTEALEDWWRELHSKLVAARDTPQGSILMNDYQSNCLQIQQAYTLACSEVTWAAQEQARSLSASLPSDAAGQARKEMARIKKAFPNNYQDRGDYKYHQTRAGNPWHAPIQQKWASITPEQKQARKEMARIKKAFPNNYQDRGDYKYHEGKAGWNIDINQWSWYKIKELDWVKATEQVVGWTNETVISNSRARNMLAKSANSHLLQLSWNDNIDKPAERLRVLQEIENMFKEAGLGTKLDWALKAFPKRKFIVWPVWPGYKKAAWLIGNLKGMLKSPNPDKMIWPAKNFLNLYKKRVMLNMINRKEGEALKKLWSNYTYADNVNLQQLMTKLGMPLDRRTTITQLITDKWLVRCMTYTSANVDSYESQANSLIDGQRKLKRIVSERERDISAIKKDNPKFTYEMCVKEYFATHEWQWTYQKYCDMRTRKEEAFKGIPKAVVGRVQLRLVSVCWIDQDCHTQFVAEIAREESDNDKSNQSGGNGVSTRTGTTWWWQISNAQPSAWPSQAQQSDSAKASSNDTSWSAVSDSAAAGLLG